MFSRWQTSFGVSLSVALVGLALAGCDADNNCAGGAERDADGTCAFNSAIDEVGSAGSGTAGSAGAKAGSGGQPSGGSHGDKIPVGGSAGATSGWPVGGSAGSGAAGSGGAAAGASGSSGQTGVAGGGQAGQGEAGQNGEAGTGQAGQNGEAGANQAGQSGEAGQGQAGQGQAGQGEAGQNGEAGTGQAGGSSVATSYCKPTLPPLSKEYPKEQVMFHWEHDGRAVRSNEHNGILFGEQQDPGNGSWSFSGRGWLIATGGLDPNDALSFAIEDPRLGWTPPPMPEKTYSDGEYLFSWSYKGQPVHARVKNGTLYANYQNEDGTWSFASSAFLSNLADNLPYLHWRCFAQNEP